jgi:hypothetical protein
MGTQQSFTMMHKWPVRQPRPYNEKLPCDAPLSTGWRVYDSLFPLAIGGTCAFPGYDLVICFCFLLCLLIIKQGHLDVGKQRHVNQLPNIVIQMLWYM